MCMDSVWGGEPPFGAGIVARGEGCIGAASFG
ncbi:hypothetical protein DO70_4386 [Burkholderia pseudomallei]|nr:hypothetical protein DO70_4386 [Burkholderia pseudomallei]